MKTNTALKTATKTGRKVQKKAPSKTATKTRAKVATKTATKSAAKATSKIKIVEEQKKSLPKKELIKLSDFVVDQIMAGSEKSSIYHTLVEMGASKRTAKQFVDEVHSQILESVKKEQPTTGLIVAASIGSVIAALLAGFVWGFLVNATGYEIGFMAWAVGVLCGFASIWFAMGRKGRALQITAITSSLIGILAGKYITFFYLYRDVVASVNGIDAASKLNIFSAQVIRSLPGNINAVVSWFDILWVGLAIFAAWEIPKGLGVKIADEPVVTSTVRRAA